MIRDIVTARNAIEALRAGVPSRHAVSQLGTTQHTIKDDFQTALESVSAGRATEPLVISADFGHGKSHLLEYFQDMAEREQFVTSYNVVSPEMPLGSGHVVLKAIAEAAHAPGRTGKAIREVATDLDANPAALAGLREWADKADIHSRFRALLHLYDKFRADEELRTQILEDFEGKPLGKLIIRQKLKEIGQAAAYDLASPRNPLLAHDRIRVLAQFFRACGCKGIVVFFDELDRMARFTKRQRFSAYEELGWWREIARTTGAGILPVFAMTTGFVVTTVTDGKNDESAFTPSKAGVSNSLDPQYGQLGIELLKAEPARLESPTAEQQEEVRYRIKAIYEQAYGDAVRLLPIPASDVHKSIRWKIRRWITEWDLMRYDPSYQPEVEGDDVKFGDDEISDAELERENNDS
jgi:GNAT superfamily N-acetyltransferase